MKYYITPTLEKGKDKINKENKYPVKLVIRLAGRKVIRYSCGIRIKESQWNPLRREVNNKAPNQLLLNRKIKSDVNKVEKAILDLQLGDQFTVQKLKHILYKGALPADFYSYIENLIHELRPPKRSYAVHKRYGYILNRIKLFAGDHLAFGDIDHSWLRRFENFLWSTGLQNNTVDKYFSVLEMFLNKAVSDKIIKENPLLGYDKPKYIQTERVWLSWEEVNKLEQLISYPMVKSMRLTLLYFLLSCYTGIRLEDWYNYSRERVKDGRFVLQADKNNKWISIKITDPLQKIIDAIGEEKLTLSKKEVRLHVKAIMALAGIEKDITPHCGRHTFATRCLSTKIHKMRIARWMGVSEGTVNIYAHLVDAEGDSDAEKAFG